MVQDKDTKNKIKNQCFEIFRGPIFSKNPLMIILNYPGHHNGKKISRNVNKNLCTAPSERKVRNNLKNRITRNILAMHKTKYGKKPPPKDRDVTSVGLRRNFCFMLQIPIDGEQFHRCVNSSIQSNNISVGDPDIVSLQEQYEKMCRNCEFAIRSRKKTRNKKKEEEFLNSLAFKLLKRTFVTNIIFFKSKIDGLHDLTEAIKLSSSMLKELIEIVNPMFILRFGTINKKLEEEIFCDRRIIRLSHPYQRSRRNKEVQVDKLIAAGKELVKEISHKGKFEKMISELIDHKLMDEIQPIEYFFLRFRFNGK